MGIDKEELFETQREVLSDIGSVDEAFLSEYSQHIPIDKELGSGYFDFHWFEHLVLGRADCCFINDHEFSNNDARYHYGVHVMLSGAFSFSTGDEPVLYAQAPEIWLTKGNLGDSLVTASVGQRIKTILIEFAEEFIESLGHGADGLSLVKKLVETPSPGVMRIAKPNAKVIERATELYEYEGATTHLERLAIQGATLSFMSDLLTSRDEGRAPSESRTGLFGVRAQKLLDEGFSQSWSTRSLALAVGTNECTLKRSFKAVTGTTINGYLRMRRMQEALILLHESSDTLSRIAERIGYSDKDYFVRVFRKYYGYHPNNIE